MMDDVNFFWAKKQPYKSIVHHMLDVGCMAYTLLTESSLSSANRLLKEFFSQVDIINEASCISALHDIGKCHPSFQNRAMDLPFIKELETTRKISRFVEFNYRHEAGTKDILERIIKNRFPDLCDDTRGMVNTLLRLHHQKGGGGRTDIMNSLNPIYWQDMQNALFERIYGIFQADFKHLEHCISHDGTAVLLWGITVLSDWLASGQEAFYAINQNLSDKQYKEKALEVSSCVLNNCGLSKGIVFPANKFTAMFPFINHETIRPVQKVCVEIVHEWHESKTVPGMVIIEAPMGEGKTETSLYLAAHLMKLYEKNGLYVALPTSATSNQMYERVNDFLQIQGVSNSRLLHSMAWMIDEKTQETDNSIHDNENDYQNMEIWLAPLRRGLLSQYAVGTVDQVMMSVMRIRCGILRTIGISSKVIIIDEVHAYDAYMYSIIERLLRWCVTLKIPVILLSATLPEERRKSLIQAYGGKHGATLSSEYPLITTVLKDKLVFERSVKSTYMHSSVAVEKIAMLGDWVALSDFAIERLKDGGCLCILLNTVREAQALFLELYAHSIDNNIEIMLFHARYPAEERQCIENKCLELFGKKSILPAEHKEYQSRPLKAILVATQVVEQSLDLDFDAMISAIAPIDLLLQRMGRLHRHAGRIRPYKHTKPLFTVLTPHQNTSFGSTEAVYSTWILKKTMEVLEGTENIKIPSDIRKLVEGVYGVKPDIYSKEEYEQWTKMIFKDDLNSESAQRVVFPLPCSDYFFANESEGFFFNEDNDDMTVSAALTRIGEPQQRCAMVTLSEIQGTDKPSKQKAKQILGRSFSIRAKDLHNAKSHPDEQPFVFAGGLLKGVTLLPTDTNKYSFIKNGRKITIIADKQLGIIKKEE
jgi:CRISPR-associated endonuclease/helicase Cas3